MTLGNFIKERRLSWRNLPEYSWARDLYDSLIKLGEVVFCTSPSWSPDCPKGKLLWLQDRFGKGFREYVFTNKKYLLAKPNSYLNNSILLYGTNRGL
jgi:hypothetical protein